MGRRGADILSEASAGAALHAQPCCPGVHTKHLRGSVAARLGRRAGERGSGEEQVGRGGLHSSVVVGTF